MLAAWTKLMSCVDACKVFKGWTWTKLCLGRHAHHLELLPWQENWKHSTLIKREKAAWQTLSSCYLKKELRHSVIALSAESSDVWGAALSCSQHGNAERCYRNKWQFSSRCAVWGQKTASNHNLMRRGKCRMWIMVHCWWCTFSQTLDINRLLTKYI